MKGRDSRGVISVPGGKLRWGCYPVGLTWRKNEGGMGGGGRKEEQEAADWTGRRGSYPKEKMCGGARTSTHVCTKTCARPHTTLDLHALSLRCLC